MASRRRSSPGQPNRALMAERRWRVRLGAAAEVDFANILKWIAENFGASLSGRAPSRDWRTRWRARCRGLQGPGRDHVGPSYAPRCATRSSRKPFPNVPGCAKQHDRNRAYPPRQNGPSAPRSLCLRREHRIKLSIAKPRKLARIWMPQRVLAKVVCHGR
jgi:hypothetical protein